MNKEEIQNYLLETMRDVAEGVLEKTNYAELRKCTVKMIGPFGATFQVEYKGQLYTAYPTDLGTVYEEGTLVYVLFSNDRTEDRKFIIGVADNYKVDGSLSNDNPFDSNVNTSINFNAPMYFKDKVFIEDEIEINKVKGTGGEISVESPIRMDDNSTIFGRFKNRSWLTGLKDSTAGMLSFQKPSSGSYYESLVTSETALGNFIGLGRIGEQFGFYGMSKEKADNSREAFAFMYKDGDTWRFSTNARLTLYENLVMQAGGDFIHSGYIQPILLQRKQISGYGQWGYEKWSDGTLICRYISFWEEKPMQNWDNVTKITNGEFGIKTFPVPFVGELPHVTMGINQISRPLIQVFGTNATLTTSGGFWLSHAVFSGTVGVRYSIEAIGRWK